VIPDMCLELWIYRHSFYGDDGGVMRVKLHALVSSTKRPVGFSFGLTLALDVFPSKKLGRPQIFILHVKHALASLIKIPI
jgi:hypothetical protein